LVKKKLVSLGKKGSDLLESFLDNFEELIAAFSMKNKLDQLESIPNIFINDVRSDFNPF
jgi:hypothetical protein